MSPDGFHFLLALPPNNELVFVSSRKRMGLALDSGERVVHETSSDEILVDIPAESSGSFPVHVTGVTLDFPFRGKHVEMRRTPDLLGEVDCHQLLEKYPEMARAARSYVPDSVDQQKLVDTVSVMRAPTIEIYFGSWCPVSATVVARVIKVLDSVAAGPVVRCVGIGTPVADDLVAKGLGLDEVPVIYLTNKDGRGKPLFASDLARPETALANRWLQHGNVRTDSSGLEDTGL